MYIEANPSRAALLAAAVACVEGRAETWSCMAALQCESTFSVAASYAPSEDPEDLKRDDAATFLLLVDAAEHGPLTQ
jgi:hypothetical protein